MAYDGETFAQLPKPRTVAKVAHACPECADTFQAAASATFCGARCKDAWHNRSSKRGRVAMPLLLAVATERRGASDVGTWARRELYALADQWASEDRAAGRAACSDYLRPKMDAGWRACDL